MFPKIMCTAPTSLSVINRLFNDIPRADSKLVCSLCAFCLLPLRLGDFGLNLSLLVILFSVSSFRRPMHLMLMPLSTLLGLLGGLIPSVAATTCYDMEGSVASGNTPCRSGSGATWCCSDAYYCMSNRLCQWQTGAFYQGSCTDESC